MVQILACLLIVFIGTSWVFLSSINSNMIELSQNLSILMQENQILKEDVKNLKENIKETNDQVSFFGSTSFKAIIIVGLIGIITLAAISISNSDSTFVSEVIKLQQEQVIHQANTEKTVNGIVDMFLQAVETSPETLKEGVSEISSLYSKQTEMVVSNSYKLSNRIEEISSNLQPNSLIMGNDNSELGNISFENSSNVDISDSVINLPNNSSNSSGFVENSLSIMGENVEIKPLWFCGRYRW